jgi:hypothetical protein
MRDQAPSVVVSSDSVRSLHVLIGVFSADAIFPVLLVGALELGIGHAQIAVGHLDAVDTRGHIADADAQFRGDEIGGEHEHGEDRQALAQDRDVAAMARGAAKGTRALVFGADAIPPAARHDISPNRHLLRHVSGRRVSSAKDKLAVRL